MARYGGGPFHLSGEGLHSLFRQQYDWICNWLSNKRWLDNLVWTGSKTYLSEEMKPWSAKVNGEEIKAGDTKTAYSLGGGRLSRYQLQHVNELLELIRHSQQKHLQPLKKQGTWVRIMHVQTMYM